MILRGSWCIYCKSLKRHTASWGTQGRWFYGGNCTTVMSPLHFNTLFFVSGEQGKPKYTHHATHYTDLLLFFICKYKYDSTRNILLVNMLFLVTMMWGKKISYFISKHVMFMRIKRSLASQRCRTWRGCIWTFFLTFLWALDVHPDIRHSAGGFACCITREDWTLGLSRGPFTFKCK